MILIGESNSKSYWVG